MIKRIKSKYVTTILDHDEAKEIRRYIDSQQTLAPGSMLIGLVTLISFPGSSVIGAAGAGLCLLENFASGTVEDQEDFYTYLGEQLDNVNYDMAKVKQKMTYVEIYKNGKLLHEGWMPVGKPRVTAVHAVQADGWETF